MEINEFINEELIKLNLKSQSKQAVIEELAAVAAAAGVITDQQQIITAALEREAKGTTGVGKGVAIPHVKSSAVKKPAVIFGRSQSGIDYQSMDEKLSYLFFLITVPENSHDQHLKLLAQLSRNLVHADFREKLMAAQNKTEVIDVLTNH
ncbi:PTS sugar transporter subunit IIA [Halanaerobium salsuginis]|uniref:PTS system D-fructose-specific IIA component (F1P-forming), Frc family n=1 Tax=Halanaerobium salsuginis TaxID=29563 RepID=A0A1I4GVL7_9FIRM|nr:fructose PTS transporter subunit IIA [Halanaerobium salsuginis]SFL33191.1 PTS system D-fructose-specific IIA component (F1P-forming), Frc family [Halanaerobium salsuginis]